MVQAANSDVPAKVSLDARDMAACVFFFFVWCLASKCTLLAWKVKGPVGQSSTRLSPAAMVGHGAGVSCGQDVGKT